MCAYCSKKAKTNPAQNKDRLGYRSDSEGSLKIIGIGPGDIRHMSQRAREAIEECEVIVGYRTYVKLLGNLAANKEVQISGMTEEIKRAKFAVISAKSGKKVCVISGGDSGVYGMAGLVLELLNKNDLNKFGIEIIPGIISATACAALLGAPLMHDFAIISLSDLLTDMDLIKRRIHLAVKADFVIVLYNPKSAKRITPFKKACGILLKYRSPSTPVGVVQNAYRKNQEVSVTTLRDLPSFKKMNMVTTIIVGNSKTYVKEFTPAPTLLADKNQSWRGAEYMITPRGYKLKSNRGSL